MYSTSHNEASASTKRKASPGSVTMPKKAIKVISLPPPESLTQQMNGILRGANRDKISNPPTFGCIDCQVSGESTCSHSGMATSNRFAIPQTNFEAELQSRLSPSAPQLQSLLQPRSGKRISWDPEIIPIERTQKQISYYMSGGEEEHWWDDPNLLQACESFLTTSDGKLLDALMSLTQMDVLNIVMQVPEKIKRMILDISRKFAEAEEMNRMNEWENWAGRIDADEEFTNADAENETEVEEDDADDQEEMLRNLAAEKIAHRRLLAEYLDSRLDDYMFCRYQGIIQHPCMCPKAELGSRGVATVHQSTKKHGPSSYIVSFQGFRNRPLLSPIRFSQACMAMKLYRQGKDYKHWIKSIKDIAWNHVKTTSHFVSADIWVTNDRLLVRTQSWIYAHSLDPASKNYVQKFLNGYHLPSYEKNPLSSWACRHLAISPSKKHIFNFDNPEESTKIRQCEECALEYRIDVVKTIPVNWTPDSPRAIGDDAFCAVVTVYRDFGRCLTPYDPRWAAHFVEYELNGFAEEFPAENQKLRDPAEEECATDWQLGGIMKAFEGMDEIDPSERSLRRPVLKILLSTEDSRKEEAKRKKKLELEKEKRNKEKLDSHLKEVEEKKQSLVKRYWDTALSMRNKKELAPAAE
ncbi:hypothetical protein IFR05_006492 [Cadophora sp. M221]|nr:hypothetical protein IFR05_006492 [Cadophora sp. M221]